MNIHWEKGLPRQYAATAVRPRLFERYEDLPAHARKFLGYDGEGRLCYYRHAYSHAGLWLDEEDCFHEDEAYYEEAIAWRLENGSWLVRRYEAGEEGLCSRRLAPPSYAIVDTALRP
jgi:hypothetical protein